MKRRDFAINSVAAASLATLPLASLAQKRKDAVVLGIRWSRLPDSTPRPAPPLR